MEISQLTLIKFTDTGQCIMYLSGELIKVELKKSGDYTFSEVLDSKCIQYDKNKFTLAISGGEIVETGHYVDNGNDLQKDWIRESITIYNLELTCYLDGEIVQNFTINGFDEEEIKTELINSL